MGDELGLLNDASYLDDPARRDDNRWMHRPVIDWKKNKRINNKGSVEERIFSGTKKLIGLRKKLDVVADHNNLTWLTPHNIHVAGYLRSSANTKLFVICNFSSAESFLTWYAFREQNVTSLKLYDHWEDKTYEIGADNEFLIMDPFCFLLLEPAR